MNTAFTIFKKELTDMLRDRRSVVMMMVIPMLVVPVLIWGMTAFTSAQVKKAEEKVLRVGLLTYGNAGAFRTMLMDREDLKIREDIQAERARELIRADSLDAVILFGKYFDRKIAGLQEGRIDLFHKSSKDRDIARKRLFNLIDEFEKRLVSERFQRLHLDENMVNTVHVERNDIASKEEKFGNTVGRFLPYIFVLFCFMGCMHPATDLGAGEKERGTLETLLASPAGRFQILVGKFGVIVLAGIASAAFSLLGMLVGIRQIKKIPPELLEAMSGILTFQSIALMLSLLLPLTMFFAAGLLAISVFAKSFKEAQGLMAPLSFVIIIPVGIGLIPGITLDETTALIPILNVSLATKEIFSQTITPWLLAEVYLSLIVLAGLSLYGCAKWFERERTIFREV